MSEGHMAQVTPGRGHGCPCGRSHPIPRRARKPRAPVDHSDLSARLYDALAQGKLETESDRYAVKYAGNCDNPLRVPSYASSGRLVAVYETRCRRCPPCLRARQFYWANAAVRWTDWTAQAGLRTWFGTLTLRPEVHALIVERARTNWLLQNAWSSAIPDWWDDASCDLRFRLVRDELVRELQLYWKRLRKQGHSFKYFLVFERHKSGLPHCHFLLHEQESHIRKRALSSAWPYGFTQVKLVRGEDPRKAAFYVAKYLGKSSQARQIASSRYAKVKTSPFGQTNE